MFGLSNSSVASSVGNMLDTVRRSALRGGQFALLVAVLPMCLGALPGYAAEAASAGSRPQTLPPGHVQGDVVSYSYVPIRTWTPREGIGILPYLFEYSLMAFEDVRPLEDFHTENVRRIDIASQWSPAIMLYARKDEWRDEIIRLMIRAYRHRQLIVLANYFDRQNKDGGPYNNAKHILEELWGNRDVQFVSPEGDQATGRQLINNVLANKCGDEGESGLGTAGLAQVYDEFDRVIRLREWDGQQPFRHIKPWYNMIGYAALDYNGGYAASQEDVDKHRRVKLVGIHCAAHLDWPEYTEMLGGYSISHPWNAGSTVVIRLEEPDHPLLRSFTAASFAHGDEIFVFSDFSRQRVRVLLSLDTTRTDMNKPGVTKDQDVPLAWIRRYGEGRVFYSALGHHKDVYWRSPILQHYLAGIQFALGDLQADAAPSSPTARLPSAPLPGPTTTVCYR